MKFITFINSFTLVYKLTNGTYFVDTQDDSYNIIKTEYFNTWKELFEAKF